METFTVVSHRDLAHVAETCLAKWCQPGLTDGALVIALHGDLGAGKTTFVQTVAAQLGITETVTSPTFVIMKSYETEGEVFTTLTHIDAYRIESIAEMAPLSFAQVLSTPHTLVCIEWAERIAPLLPDTTIHLTFTLQADETRTITYGEKN
jgi:tRNA threonylcarbamoyladenosine biosynthesis protein TsaE